MTARLLLLLVLASAAARAERSWVFERGQSIVTAEAGPKKARLSVVSSGLSGRLQENDKGELSADLTMDRIVHWLTLVQTMLLSHHDILPSDETELREMIRRFIVYPLLKSPSA